MLFAKAADGAGAGAKWNRSARTLSLYPMERQPGARAPFCKRCDPRPCEPEALAFGSRLMRPSPAQPRSGKRMSRSFLGAAAR
jgi:hypothetical protein